MKTIFIATDFSSDAHQAAVYGVNLATYLGANIVLFHAYQTPISIPESFFVVTPDEMKNDAEQKLLMEVKSIRLSETQPINIIAAEGDVHEIIFFHTAKYEKCLLVCGRRGKGKINRFYFGSTATKFLQKNLLPVLVVPEEALYHPINRIALAIEEINQTDMVTFDMLQSIGEKFDAIIYIVNVMNASDSEVSELSFRSERILNKFKLLKPEYKFIKSDDLSEALDTFIKENNIHLLSLISHHHTIFERIFIKSSTKELIFHSQIPLLLLPEIKEKNSIVKKMFQ